MTRGAGEDEDRAAGKPRQRTEIRDGVIAWFRRHASERLPESVEAWRSKIGVPMPPVIVSDPQKRWGICDRNCTIRLNWGTIQAPMRLVDYVVVLELVCTFCTVGTAANTGKRSDV